MGASNTVQKPLMKLVDRNLSGGSCNADKLAFSKAKPADISVDERVDLAQHIIVEDNCQTSPKHSSSHPPQSGKQKEGACLESSIVIILSIILAVVIKVLELFEVVITSTVEVLKRPPVSSKGHATLFSGASTPKFSALSIQDKTPECLCEVSKGEPQSSRAVVEENSLVFEQADEIYDDIIISEVIPHSVKITDSNKTLCSDYSPLTNSNIKSSQQGSTSLSVSRTLNNPSSRARAEKECSASLSADYFVQPISNPISNSVEDKVDNISTSFVPSRFSLFNRFRCCYHSSKR